jgi:hypothetical protein
LSITLILTGFPANTYSVYDNRQRKSPGNPGLNQWRWGELNPFKTLDNTRIYPRNQGLGVSVSLLESVRFSKSVVAANTSTTDVGLKKLPTRRGQEIRKYELLTHPYGYWETLRPHSVGVSTVLNDTQR